MISLGPEPHGLLLRAADVRAWLPGLSRHQWLRVRRSLRVVSIDGKPYYRREEVRAKLVAPVAHSSASTLPIQSAPLSPASTQSSAPSFR